MTEQRQKEIKKEAKRRVDLWLANTSFEEMTVNGSFIRFNMAIGLLGGYPLRKEKWMNKDDFGGFITVAEFYSQEYDSIVHSLFSDYHP